MCPRPLGPTQIMLRQNCKEGHTWVILSLVKAEKGSIFYPFAFWKDPIYLIIPLLPKETVCPEASPSNN